MNKKTLHNNPKKIVKVQTVNKQIITLSALCFTYLKSNSKYQNTLLVGLIIKVLKRLFLNQFRNIFSLSVTKYSSTWAIQQHSKQCSSPTLCDRRSTKYTPSRSTRQPNSSEHDIVWRKSARLFTNNRPSSKSRFPQSS